jgi:hypothetical protein
MQLASMVRVSGQTASHKEYGQSLAYAKKARPYSWWRIILGVATGRQRAVRRILWLLMALGALANGLACEANNSMEAARTAVTAAQTGVTAAQTVMPGAQATVVAGATLVSNAVSVAQPVFLTLQGLLQGVSLDVRTSPAGAESNAVTEVSIEGTDNQGRLGQIDAQTRQTAATAALVAARQYYPNATITLKVVDDAGNTLLSGNMAPGQTPSVQ